MKKAAGILLALLLLSSVTVAQESEFTILTKITALDSGPPESEDPMAGLALQPEERTQLESLSKERLDALLLQAVILRRPCASIEFLEAGADPNGFGRAMGRPLWFASESQTDELVRLLLLYGADPNLVPDDGNTALMCAARHGRAPIVRALLDAGADFNCWDRDGNTALDYAVAGKHDACIEMLVP